MSLVPSRFDPGELAGRDDESQADDVAGLTAVARTLEQSAASTPDPTPIFVDAVMAAIAAEPGPAPARRFVASVRRLSLVGLATALGDAWRTAISGPRPVAARAAALALVLTVAGAAIATGGAVVVGAGWVLSQRSDGPTPTVPVSPRPTESSSPVPSPSPSAVPSPSPSPSTSPEPSASTEPTEAVPTATAEATEGPEGTDGPEDTPEPDDSEKPEGSDDHSGSGGGGSGSEDDSSGGSGSG